MFKIGLLEAHNATKNGLIWLLVMGKLHGGG
jgi:hypothetical protein